MNAYIIDRKHAWSDAAKNELLREDEKAVDIDKAMRPIEAIHKSGQNVENDEKK